MLSRGSFNSLTITQQYIKKSVLGKVNCHIVPFAHFEGPRERKSEYQGVEQCGCLPCSSKICGSPLPPFKGSNLHHEGGGRTDGAVSGGTKRERTGEE
jgi:hypothetical protein